MLSYMWKVCIKFDRDNIPNLPENLADPYIQLCLSFHSCVKQHSPTATFQQFSTAAATTALRSQPSSCNSLATLQICVRLCATFATSSRQEDYMQWARALVRAFSCLTWGSVDHPATWQRLSASRPCSAVRAGLRTGFAGRCSGPWYSTRRSVLAGMEGTQGWI